MFGNFRFLIFFCVLLTAGANTLPVFIVQRHQATGDETLALAEGLFGPDDYNLTMFDERYIVSSFDGSKRVEYDTVSGGIWATDDSEPWNTTSGAPNLPTPDEAVQMAEALVTQLKLLPAEEGSMIIKSGRTSGTLIAHEYGDGSGGYIREEYGIDVSANFDITLRVPDRDVEFPLVGGGGKFQVTYGNCGKLIAFQGLWREIVGQKSTSILSQEEADARYLASLGDLGGGSVNFSSILAYYSQPFGALQKRMSPVYVYTGETVIGDESFTLRPQTSRASDSTSASYTSSTEVRRSLGHLHTRSLDDVVFEAATEWLGDPYGLSQAGMSAEGFKSGIIDAFSLESFAYNKSNQDVLATDFVDNDDEYVDSVDMLFYVGHANGNGWLANNPNMGGRVWVNYASFGTRPEIPGDRLGQQDLEWLIIAACGPHQDELIQPGAGNVFDRWRGIFDGLHIMFGYASNSYDSSQEGARFIKYAEEGSRLIDAWFRAAKDSQPSNVIVSAMWTDDALNDHLPGYGPVSTDNPLGSQERWTMWTTC